MNCLLFLERLTRSTLILCKFFVEISLMESNYVKDDVLGTTYFNISDLTLDQVERRTFIFNGVSYVRNPLLCFLKIYMYINFLESIINNSLIQLNK